MSMTDPIADMLTRIRNANKAFIDEIAMPSSRIKVDIAKILKDEGFIEDFRVSDEPNNTKALNIRLKFGENKLRCLNGIKRISRPGLRVYVRKDDIPKVLGGLGEAIVSTSKGVTTGKDARRSGLGGEVICYVW